MMAESSFEFSSAFEHTTYVLSKWPPIVGTCKTKNGTDDQLQGTTSKLTDPFVEDETDPEKCQAFESSLWELETLRHHYYPGINSLIELFEKPINKDETNLSKYWDSSFETLFQEECIELTKNNAFVEFHKPKGLLSDAMDELWCLNN